jgi:hypothetical protein
MGLRAESEGGKEPAACPTRLKPSTIRPKLTPPFSLSISVARLQSSLPSACARRDCVLLRLTIDNYRRFTTDHPQEAGQFSAFVVRLMAERLARANSALLASTR